MPSLPCHLDDNSVVPVKIALDNVGTALQPWQKQSKNVRKIFLHALLPVLFNNQYIASSEIMISWWTLINGLFPHYLK